MSAASATDAWAVGRIGMAPVKTLVMHWNGAGWSRVASPSPGGMPNGSSLNGVSAVSASDAWAAGDYAASPTSTRTLVVHWNGTGWRRVASPSPGTGFLGNQLTGVSAVTGSDVWAVGNYSTGSRPAKDLVLHWDGARWARVASPSPGGRDGSGLSGVSAASGSDAWAVGCDDFNVSTGASSTLALHWDGTHWTHVASPTPGAAHSGCLSGVTTLTASDAWAAGYYTASNSAGSLRTLVLHWDGRRWTQVASPAPGGTLSSFLNAMSASSAVSVWAVGAVFDGDSQSQRTLVLHWNGTRWTRMASPSPGFSNLAGVSGLSRSDAWAVGHGSNSLILHWNGTRWTQS